MSDIIRTRCGDLCLKESFLLEEIKSGYYEIIKPEKLFKNEEIILNIDDTNRVLNGVKITIDLIDGEYKVFGYDRIFIGLGEVKDKILKIILRLI